MPSEVLQGQYYEWLSSEASSSEGIGICMAQYALSSETFDIEEQYGEPMTEDELLTAERAEEAQGTTEGDPTPRLEMEAMPLPFVAANCHVVKASTREHLLAWLDTDPIAALGGYSSVATYRWSRSEDPSVNVQLMPPHGYAVFCLDHPGKTSVRAATRPAHLDWLAESGRVHLAGPLHDPEKDEERIGTFLIVNGDSCSEVSLWASADPYAAAGLFASVSVSPLLNYGVTCLPLGFQPLPRVVTDESI